MRHRPKLPHVVREGLQKRESCPILEGRGGETGRFIDESWLINPFQAEEKGKGIKVGEWLVSLGIDEVVTAKSFAHKGPHYVFSDNEVEMRQTDGRNLNEIKESLIGSPAGGSSGKDTTIG